MLRDAARSQSHMKKGFKFKAGNHWPLNEDVAEDATDELWMDVQLN